MKTIGTICYEVCSGLGILARDFYLNGVINKALVIRHPRYTPQTWFAPADRFSAYSPQSVSDFLDQVDALLLFENTFNNWTIVEQARARKKPVALMPMYEYTPYPLPTPVDLYICPSMLEVTYYKNLPWLYIPVPVPRHIKWKKRTRALTFVHNAGHGGKDFRNGTPEILEALKHIHCPFRLIMRGQPDSQQIRQLYLTDSRMHDTRISTILANISDESLWEEGDVFLFPEKFNGLSLPMQEAFASGMLVMGNDRYPMNTWLPREPLIPIVGYRDKSLAVIFKEAIIDPRTIAQTIEKWHGEDISTYSEQGRLWGLQHSWDVLGPQYRLVMEDL